MQKIGNNIRLGTVLLLVSFAVFSLALYGGSKLVEVKAIPAPTAAPEAATEATTPGGPTTVDIVAKNLKFDKRSLTASVGGEVTVNFNNEDAGVAHNFAVYNSRGATQTIFKGELFPGVATRSEKFTAPATAGTYYFRCDVHPDTMNGSFIVK